MELTERHIGDTLIISIVGRLETSSALAVDRTVNQRIDEGERRIVFHLSKLEYMSSSGLRLFIGIGKRLKSEGGGFALSCAPESQKELLQMAQMNQVVPLFDSDGQAVIALSKKE